MKYIRTANEIYDKDDLYICEELNGKPYGVKGNSWVIYHESIIKEADTIEELCDEFVGIDIDGHYIIHNDGWLEGARIIPLNEITYYGAIWTDKGLIYVAKMNEKGELELL